MRKPLWFSLLLAGVLIILLTVAVGAQERADDTVPTAITVAQIEPITTTIRQQVPLSITIRVPLGTTDTQTVTVPILLNLNLQLTLGDLASPTLDLTTTLSPLLTPTNTLTSVPTPAATVTAVAPPTPLPATPTAIPTTVSLTATETLTTSVGVTATPVSTVTVILAPDCADPRARIIAPGVGQVLSGTVPILGSAAHEDFQYYKLEYTPGTDGGVGADYFYFGGGESQVENGELAFFATQPLANGPYVLRLTVVDNTGNFPTPCTVPVEVAN